VVLNLASKRAKRLCRAAATVGAGLPLGLAVAALGCHFDEKGLDDILSPSPTYVSFLGHAW
jgi:hypothetical protein